MNIAPYRSQSPSRTRALLGMTEQKTAQRPRPYAALGERLRARKEELITAGRLPNDLVKIAKLAGVSVSGFQQWERGETWPRKAKRATLTTMLDWSEQELDFGPQETQGVSEMSSHPVSPEELEVLALYRGLEDDKAAARAWLMARLHTRHALKQQVKGPLRTVTDQQVEQKMPVTAPGRRSPAKVKRKGPGTPKKG